VIFFIVFVCWFWIEGLEGFFLWLGKESAKCGKTRNTQKWVFFRNGKGAAARWCGSTGGVMRPACPLCTMDVASKFLRGLRVSRRSGRAGRSSPPEMGAAAPRESAATEHRPPVGFRGALSRRGAWHVSCADGEFFAVK
jgi:hypothetical protein